MPAKRWMLAGLSRLPSKGEMPQARNKRTRSGEEVSAIKRTRWL
jgi:hypothetical protein